MNEDSNRRERKKVEANEMYREKQKKLKLGAEREKQRKEPRQRKRKRKTGETKIGTNWYELVRVQTSGDQRHHKDCYE